MSGDTRHRLAKALHDGVGQTLAGIALQIDYIVQQESDAEIADRLKRLAAAARSGLEDVRRISRELDGEGRP